MKCPWSKINLGWACGDIFTLSRQAVEVAKLLNTKVTFDFNGVKVCASPITNPRDLSASALGAVEEGKGSVYGEGF